MGLDEWGGEAVYRREGARVAVRVCFSVVGEDDGGVGGIRQARNALKLRGGEGVWAEWVEGGVQRYSAVWRPLDLGRGLCLTALCRWFVVGDCY